MIYIVLDTNFLNVSEKCVDLASFKLNRNFEDLKVTIHSPNIKDSCKICIPQLVISELLKHRLEYLDSFINQINDNISHLGSLCAIELEIDKANFEGEDILSCKTYLEKEGIQLLPICDSSNFNNIVEDSIKKNPPFEGAKGKADKGFKDVVIWYSLIQWARQNPGEFIFATNDAIFHSTNSQKYLKGMFSRDTNCNITFCQSIDEIKNEVLKNDSQKFIDSITIIDSIKSWEFVTENETDVSVKCVYPELQGKDNSISLIQKSISNIYEATISEWKEEHSKRIADSEENLHYRDNLKYTVLYNEHGKLSIRFERYAYYEEGIHGTYFWTPVIYDLNTSKKLKLTDLLGDFSGDILAHINQKFTEDKKNNPTKYWEDFTLKKYTTIDDFKFFYDAEGIHIYFDPYEASCYASGFVDFII